MTRSNGNGRAPIVPDGRVRTWSGMLVGWRGPIPPLEDFLMQLARIPRFGGATEPEFTVLQHSYHAYLIAEDLCPEVRLHALLHDFSEILIGDIQSPMKVRAYGPLERGFVELASEKFRLGLEWSEEAWAKVHRADGMATNSEGRHLTSGEWPEAGRAHLDAVLGVCPAKYPGRLQNLIGKIIEGAKSHG